MSKDPSLPYYLTRAGRYLVGFVPSQKVLALYEM